MLAVKNSSVRLAAAGVGVKSAGRPSWPMANALNADLSSTSAPMSGPHELERFARQLKPILAGCGIDMQPLFHGATLAGVEVLAGAGGYECVDTCLGQLDHKASLPRPHGEDLVVDLERLAAEEPAAGLDMRDRRISGQRLDDGREPRHGLVFGVRHLPLPSPATRVIVNDNVLYQS